MLARGGSPPTARGGSPPAAVAHRPALAKILFFRMLECAMSIELENWEDTLQLALSEIDARLEEKYGGLYPLHPARPARGSTANPQYDGLFRVTAVFSAGIGSEYGKGYLFRVEMVSLAAIPEQVLEKIEEEAAELLRKELEQRFPGRELHVERDGRIFKIHGDLSLS